MDISSISPSPASQTLKNHLRLEIKNESTLGWTEFQAQVKEEELALQNKNSVALIKKTGKLADTQDQSDPNLETESAESETQANWNQENALEAQESTQSLGGTVDKTV